MKQYVPQEKSKLNDHQQILRTSVNPLPNISEEYQEQYKEGEEYVQPPSNPHNISNYNYYQQNNRGTDGFSQPHEIKKANFEQNRRTNISAVSSNIVSSREKLQNDHNNNMSEVSNSISHSKNTNKGYVRMTGGAQFGIPSQTQNNEVIQPPQQETSYSQPIIQRNTGHSMNMPESIPQYKPKGKKKIKDSILNQYNHNLPPTQIEYQSGFQDIPPPMVNPGESTLKK